MDISFKDFLVMEGIREETVLVLEEQQINTKEVFCLLETDHFEKMMSKDLMTLGQHAKLKKLWKNSSLENRPRHAYSPQGIYIYNTSISL